MKWEEAAEKLQITQITKPEIVLDFINFYTGLSSICHSYPNYFALYAPQLTIKGLGGEFEKDFDELLKYGQRPFLRPYFLIGDERYYAPKEILE